VGPSCEAAGRGAVLLGRNKEACLADENQALNTLKQNWSKYVAGDKTLCIGMESTGGPASYVELLSCIEVNRDARDIQSADPLEADLNSPPSTTTGSASTEPRHRRDGRATSSGPCAVLQREAPTSPFVFVSERGSPFTAAGFAA
jgi:hypothetical protein